MALAADVLRGYTDAILLQQLADGDSYGYQMNKEISAASQGAFELKEATLYTAFRRLEAGGWIRSYWGEEGAGARRRYYALTALGRERLAQERETWRETRQLLNQLLMAEETEGSVHEAGDADAAGEPAPTSAGEQDSQDAAGAADGSMARGAGVRE